MRLELAILSRGGTGRDDAQLAPGQIQARPAEHLAVTFGDHPAVERWMQLSNVVAQLVVHRSVHARARELAALARDVRGDIRLLGRGRGSADAAPFTHAIQRARETREQVRLQYCLLDPFAWRDVRGRA